MEAFRVALTDDQVLEYDLPPGGTVDDKNDVNARDFEDKYGPETYEVEALPPEELAAIVEEAVEAVIDHEAFNAEVDAEEEDWEFLSAKRETIIRLAADLDDEDAA
jgi:hypothetical protein